MVVVKKIKKRTQAGRYTESRKWKMRLGLRKRTTGKIRRKEKRKKIDYDNEEVKKEEREKEERKK